MIHVDVMYYPLDRSVRKTGPAAKIAFARQLGCFFVIEGGFCQFLQMPVGHLRSHVGIMVRTSNASSRYSTSYAIGVAK